MFYKFIYVKKNCFPCMYYTYKLSACTNKSVTFKWDFDALIFYFENSQMRLIQTNLSISDNFLFTKIFD